VPSVELSFVYTLFFYNFDSVTNDLVFAIPYFSDHKAQYQKLTVCCSFFIYKTYWIIRRIKWSKAWTSQTVL